MAWSTIREIAVDHRQPAARRVAALRKFLAEFKDKSPHAAEANQLLVKLLPGFLTVTTSPEGARVLLDGSPVGGSPITMYTGLGAGGALLITGIVLWALSSGDEQPAEWIGPSFGLAPDGDGMGLSISGRW